MGAWERAGGRAAVPMREARTKAWGAGRGARGAGEEPPARALGGTACLKKPQQRVLRQGGDALQQLCAGGKEAHAVRI